MRRAVISILVGLGMAGAAGGCGESAASHPPNDGGPVGLEDGATPGTDGSGPDAPDAPADAQADGEPPPSEGGDADGAPPSGTGLSAKYPGDQGIGADPDVLFHSDFEDGFTGWTRHSQDQTLLDVDTDAARANGGSRYLRASISRSRLAEDNYIGVNAQYDLETRVPVVFWRFYAKFVGTSVPPHHWVRLAAGTPAFQSDGLANTVPSGNQGFWYDLDAHDDGNLSFYAYWYKMRSGRCNDGSATPGCAGDQGTTYYYGNNFTPAGQAPFPRDRWFCIETMTKVNTVGSFDGELALWVDDALVGEYKTGTPRGRWLRDNFYSFGPYFQDQGGFEGFDWRSSDDVLVRRITLDTYFEKGSLDARIARGLVAPETQEILYDDVVLATRRVGCKVR
ncbi:MAG: hypothetical protein OZ921_09020 [Sorangiineae bacterium]|nr:hypothetical protein [Polyangiaceae bacterium]MEB2322643.1 hypothetical protein [Sorangiineae bacterium]